MKKILAAAGLMLSLPTHSAIIDNGTYMTDTTSALEWRDITDTVNLSHSYVSGQFGAGGLFEGWRYATLDDMYSLVANFDGHVAAPSNPSGTAISDYDLSAGELGWNLLFDYWGDTYAYPPEYEFLDGIFENGSIIQYAVLKDTLDNSNDFYSLTQSSKTSTFTSSFSGSFLVRGGATVPVPAAAWLFGSALLGLGWMRRKA